MPHPFSRYRVRLLGDFIRIIVVPSVILKLFFLLTDSRPGLLTLPSYAAFCFAISYARNTYAYFTQEHLARQMGGRLASCVVGKWPGNLDVMLKMIKASKTAYLGEFYHELFHQYQSTTLNLRLLWSDFVRPFTTIQCCVPPWKHEALTQPSKPHNGGTMDHRTNRNFWSTVDNDGRRAYQVHTCHRFPPLLARTSTERAHVCTQPCTTNFRPSKLILC